MFCLWKKPKLSSDFSLLSLLAIAVAITIISIIISANNHAANAAPSQSQLVYGCTKFGPAVRCDPMSNKFKSFTSVGHVQPNHTINQSKFEPAEGVFGNALAIHGSKLEYFSMPNQQGINPSIFSVSFWMKQDPQYLGNSSVISHTNFARTAGWYFELYSRNSQSYIQFSITNSEGKQFSVSSAIDPDVFQNVAGTFDGKVVKIYLNGFLVNSKAFVGNYSADPNTPLNVGLNSYDYGRSWNGAIDEIRLYNRAISEDELQNLSDYSKYLQSSRSPSNDKGLIAYLPFDGRTQDSSGNQHEGKIVLPTVSMVFSPDGRLFFSVRDSGEIRIMKQDGTVFDEPFVSLPSSISNTHHAILGITLDPDFPTNHYVYAYTTARDNDTGNIFNRVERFTELENRATDGKILVDKIPAGNGRYYAGALAFGADDKLYVGTDYTVNDKDSRLNTNLTGKVLRINRDGTIPEDNPFPNSPVYTLDHRNIFGIAIDKKTGTAIIAENDARYHDEINVLTKGGNYGFPAVQPTPPSSLVRSSQTDNSSTIKPARTYYNPITPTQAVYYDGNKFPALKNKFLVVSYGERSIYSLSINKSGSIVEEVGIRLPEVRGHIISIAKAPNGDLYVGGENIYKLVSIDRNTNTPLIYFVDVAAKNIKINDLSLNLTNKVMSLNFTNKNSSSITTDGNIEAAVPSSPLQVRIPKVLLGGIFLVTSDKYNSTSTAQNAIEDLKIKESLRVSNVGDTIIDIKLNGNIINDKILIKGQTSTLVQAPVRKTTIYR